MLSLAGQLKHAAALACPTAAEHPQEQMRYELYQKHPMNNRRRTSAGEIDAARAEIK